MSVSHDDVRHVATLARLAIDDARLPSLVAELNGILLHIDELQQADLSAFTVQADAEGMMLRPDDAPPVSLHRTREQFAPQTRDGFFLVPRLATHGDAGATTSTTSGEHGA